MILPVSPGRRLLFQQVGDRWFFGNLWVLGFAAEHEGNYQKARQYFQEAFSIHQEVNDFMGMTCSLQYLGNLELAHGEPLTAKFYFRRLLKFYADLSHSGFPIALCNLGAAEVLCSQSLPSGESKALLKVAARLFGAAEAMGIPTIPKDLNLDPKFYPLALEQLRDQLDPEELAAAWAEGAALQVDEVYRYALEESEN
jgi:tetratricopeptide (TPR) repeat protein